MESANKNYEDNKVLIEFINVLKLIIYSLIGVFIFFIPIKVNGQSATIIYHMAYKLQLQVRPFLEACVILYLVIGCIKPIIKNNKNSIFVYLRIFSVLIILIIFNGKNEIILLDDSISLLMYDLILNISTIFPLSAIFITFLFDYGMLDIVESYSHTFMKKNFNLSGKTLVNIFIYFSTDCFCGMFMTNKLYKEGKIRENEACNIILNFSILSFPMALYTSNELDLKNTNLIIISIVILILINLITCRIYPINKKKKSYYIKTNYKETIHKKEKLEKAVKQYLRNRSKVNIFKSMLDNFEESIYVLINFIPNLVLVLYLGQMIINSNLIIEVIQVIFNPILELLKIQNKEVLSKFTVDVFYNGVIGIENINSHTQYYTKFLIGIIAILNCTSISSNMIYIKNTNIKITTKEFLISYIQRIILIIFIYSIMYYFYRGYIM